MFICAAGWGLIFHFNPGYFKQQAATSLVVKLQYRAPTPEPEVPLSPVTTSATPRPGISQPADEQAATTPTAQPSPEMKPAPSSPSDVNVAAQDKTDNGTSDVLLSSSQDAVAERYYMKLLSWFAQPQHQNYDQQTRQLNLKGEIKVEITILRDGSIHAFEVLESTSERLTEATRTAAFKASPYPPVPEEISGATYSFTLPLRYTLEP